LDIKSKLSQKRWFQSLVKGLDNIKLPFFGSYSVWQIVLLLKRSFKKNAYDIRSSSVAFKFFLAIFPALLFVVSLIPYIPISNFQDSLLGEIKWLMPNNIYPVVEQTILDLVETKHYYVLGIGLVLSLYFASNGIAALLKAFSASNQVYFVQSPVKTRIQALLIFVVFVLFVIISLGLLTFGEWAVSTVLYKSYGDFAHFVFHLVKWIGMLFSMIIGVSVLYNFGNPERTEWSWVSPGASLASIVIIVVSWLMSYFFLNFSSYNELYGSIGTVIMILLWLKITAYILILGFELHALTTGRSSNISN